MIELDDKTHEAEKRKQRDDMLDCLLKNKVNIPYLHVAVESMNDKPQVWNVYKESKLKNS